MGRKKGEKEEKESEREIKQKMSPTCGFLWHPSGPSSP